MQGVCAAERCASGSRQLRALATPAMNTQGCTASRTASRNPSALWGSQLPATCHLRKSTAACTPISPASRLRVAAVGASSHGRESSFTSSITSIRRIRDVCSISSSFRNVTRDSTAVASSSSASSSSGGSSSSSSVAAGTSAIRSRSRRLSGPNVIEFSASLETNIPLKQHPQATFDDYLEESDRVFQAFFPDKERCTKVGKHTWRIFMLPIEFFLLSVHPVVDMDIVLDPRPNRTTYKGANSVIHLNSTRWELKGVDYNPSEFLLSLAGSLYATQGLPTQGPRAVQGLQGALQARQGVVGTRSQAGSASAAAFTSTSTNSSSSTSSSSSSLSTSSSSSAFSSSSASSSSPSSSSYATGALGGGGSSLRGRMTASVALVAPGILAALPHNTISSVGSMVLTRLLGAMKDKVNSRVVSDYQAFVLQKTGTRL